MSQQPNSKSLSSDYETAWSPTSPLEFRLFSSLGNPFGGSSSFLRSIPRKSWDSGKVGLRIVDSLDDHHADSSRILLPSPDSKNMIFGSLMMNPFAKSPPIHKDDDKPSGDSSYSGAGNVSVNNNDACQLDERIESEVEIPEEEDYTCVISHGPNPKTTHIYGSQVLEEDGMEKGCCEDKKESIFVIAPIDLETIVDDELLLPPSDFLSFCSLCSKKLGMGKDIYMYRGYKAFCSSECRSEVIYLDEDREEEEEADKSDSSSDKDLSKKKSNGVIFTVG